MRFLLLCWIGMHTFEVKIQDSDQSLLRCTRCGKERAYDGPGPGAARHPGGPEFPVT
jgi:hypothetical protein